MREDIQKTIDGMSANQDPAFSRRVALQAKAEAMPDGPEKTALLAKLAKMQTEGTARPSIADLQPAERPVTSCRARITWKGAVLITIFGLFVFCGLFPPWKSVVDYNGIHLEELLGHHLLFDPPGYLDIRGVAASAKIDFARLGIQWFLLVVTAAVIVWLRRSWSKHTIREKFDRQNKA